MSNIFLGKSWSLNESKEKYFLGKQIKFKNDFFEKI